MRRSLLASEVIQRAQVSEREIQKVKMMQRKWDNLLLKIRDPFVDSRQEILFFKQKKLTPGQGKQTVKSKSKQPCRVKKMHCVN